MHRCSHTGSHSLCHTINTLQVCLLISTDSNADETEIVLDAWVSQQRKAFAGIEYVKPANHTLAPPTTAEWNTSDDCEFRPHCWTDDRTTRVSKLRDAAYKRALESGARYFASVDSDVLLGDTNAINNMIESMPTPAGVVALQLLSTPNTWDSNVWLETDDNGFYKRGKFQLSFRSRKFKGCVSAAAVHSLFAVDLRAPGADRIEFFTEQRFVSGDRKQNDIVSFFPLFFDRAGCQTCVLACVHVRVCLCARACGCVSCMTCNHRHTFTF